MKSFKQVSAATKIKLKIGDEVQVVQGEVYLVTDPLLDWSIESDIGLHFGARRFVKTRKSYSKTVQAIPFKAIQFVKSK